MLKLVAQLEELIGVEIVVVAAEADVAAAVAEATQEPVEPVLTQGQIWQGSQNDLTETSAPGALSEATLKRTAARGLEIKLPPKRPH